MGDHLRQSGTSTAAIVGPGGPSMATKSAIDGPGGPVVAGDHLRHDSSLSLGIDLATTWVSLARIKAPNRGMDCLLSGATLVFGSQYTTISFQIQNSSICDRLCENPPCTHLVVIRETPVQRF